MSFYIESKPILFQRIINSFLFLILVTNSSLSLASDFPNMMAMGDLRGHIEPCGCNPKTDMGGIFRTLTLIEKIRSNPTYRDTIFVNLGNNFHLERFDLNDQYIQKAIKSSHFDVVLLNSSEWKNKNHLDKSIPYLLSNGIKADKFSRKIRAKGVTFLGYYWEKALSHQLKKVDASLLKNFKNLIGNSKSKVLLFSGSNEELLEFQKANLFDLIISSNKNSFDINPDGSEKQNPGRLIRIENQFGFVRMTPIGGQGALFFGNLQDFIAFPSLNTTKPGPFGINSPTNKNSLPFSTPNPDKPVLLSKTPIQWLSYKFEENTQTSKLELEYRSAGTNRYQNFVNSRIAKNFEPQFIGADKCQKCHETDYKIWKNTRHAAAFKTLKDKDKHQDLNCIGCHVVGFDAKKIETEGYLSEATTPHLKNVQCEVCHGSRIEHVKNPFQYGGKGIKDPKAVCISCHHPPHTVMFDYESFYKKIAHGEK